MASWLIWRKPLKRDMRGTEFEAVVTEQLTRKSTRSRFRFYEFGLGGAVLKLAL